jgi:hypothetical protein
MLFRTPVAIATIVYLPLSVVAVFSALSCRLACSLEAAVLGVLG